MYRPVITLTNKLIELNCAEDASRVVLRDRARDASWYMNRDRMVYGGKDGAGGRATPLKRLKPLRARKTDDGVLTLAYSADGDEICIMLSLLTDCVEITIPAFESRSVGVVSMPFAWEMCDGRGDCDDIGARRGCGKKYLLPIMQGMLWDGRGDAFEHRRGDGEHVGFSMAMFGILGEKSGLLLTAESADDCCWWFGKNERADFWCTNLQSDSLGKMRYDRSARIYPTPPSITAVAKAYKLRVKQRGGFVGWEEKIAGRPALERLFGALMCFIGYCRDDGVDYAKECGKLKAYGFDRALIYPARFNAYNTDFMMGGYPPINLSRETVAQIKALGYDVAPWTWINEAIDDGAEASRMFRLGASGNARLNWQIDDYKWYGCCSSFMPGFVENAVKTDMRDMTWDHFDVVTCAMNGECHDLTHGPHAGRRLSKTEDRDWIKKALRAGQAGRDTDQADRCVATGQAGRAVGSDRTLDAGRAVSSESFNDAYSTAYDIGSVKAWAQFGPWAFWPIPLTMLVYHDSMIHSWWEPHNYNNDYISRNLSQFQYGGGRARIMSAMDALYGCPPDAFPFGAMYTWTGNGRETFGYKFKFEDPQTQYALKLALPVAKNHAKIGKLELIDFKILSADGNIQETTFADGTRVVANFSPEMQYTDENGSVAGESWKVFH